MVSKLQTNVGRRRLGPEKQFICLMRRMRISSQAREAADVEQHLLTISVPTVGKHKAPQRFLLWQVPAHLPWSLIWDCVRLELSST